MTDSIHYILFTYVGDSDEGSEPVAALILQPLDNETGSLAVYTRSNWDQGLEHGEPLELAKEILDDWSHISPSEAAAVFRDLREAANGPLRATKSGACAAKELERLLCSNFGEVSQLAG